MPLPKFNFIPESQLHDEYHAYTPAKVSIIKSIATVKDRKHSIFNLRFASETVKLYDLEDKFIKFYIDKEKRVLGWTLIEGDTTLTDLSHAHKLKKNQKSGSVIIGIGKLLKAAGLNIQESLKGLEVKKPKTPLMSHEIFYVEIPKPQYD